MSWLKKLLGREQSHEDWLAEHPGKGAPTSMPPAVSDEEEKATRSRMENELDAQRTKREQP